MIKRVVIVGGGIIGTSCALALAARGVVCTVVDPDPRPTGASFGNAGHIAVEQVEPLASVKTIRSLPHRLFFSGGALALPPREISAWLPFSLRLLAAARPRRFAAGKAALAPLLADALPAWRRMLDSIKARELLREEGHFVAWETPATAAAGRAAWAAADTGVARFRDATHAELERITALIARPLAGAIRFSGTGQIADLAALADALALALAARGGERRVGRVVAIDSSGTGVTLTGGARLSADAVVVAAGAQSGTLLAPLGHRVPLIAERGYHIEGPAEDWPADLPPIVFEDRAMIVTRFRSTLRAASFVEFARASAPADPRKWARLRTHASTLGVPIGDGAREWMGVRPTLPDYVPAIGRSSRAGRIYYAFGHQHLGLTLGPVTGERIAALMMGEEDVLRSYSLERFG